ncbi:hypothetical protein LINPERHAP2_LOCUS20917 [Linum perenne]
MSVRRRQINHGIVPGREQQASIA